MLEITDQMAAQLVSDRAGLAHTSTADRVAQLLRTRIMEGLFPPGTRLSEEAIGAALGVSRNTLREAFRLLSHERLAVHQLNRGTFVRVHSREDVIDLYTLRRLVEGGAIRSARHAPPTARLALLAPVEQGEAAASDGRWMDFRTADLHFHLAITGLVESPRVDELMRRALAELRLAFHTADDVEAFHRQFVARNREIAELVVAEDRGAERALMRYLDDAERELLTLYARSAPA